VVHEGLDRRRCDLGSCASNASSTESLMRPQILSGWPSVTDSLGLNSRASLTVRKPFQNLVSRIISLPCRTQARSSVTRTLTHRLTAFSGYPPLCAGRPRSHQQYGCHQSFRTVLQCDFLLVRRQQPAVVVVHSNARFSPTALTTSKSQPFRCTIGARVEEDVAVGVASFRSEPNDGSHVGQLDRRRRARTAPANTSSVRVNS